MIRDSITGEYTLVGATRGARPNEYRDGPSLGCPFCPGNEAQTPPELARIGEREWRVRAFANKYPAVVPPEGAHEVIVDAPTHDVEITREGMEMWRERYGALRERFPHGWPVLFKNRGAYAGATILHPHTQAIAVARRPVRWEAMTQAARAGAGCPWCAEIHAARERGLVVAEHDAAIAYVRENSRFGWALTLAPLECSLSLDRASEAAWTGAGALLAAAVEVLLGNLGAASPFNVLVPSDPHAAPGTFHWHLELVPRLATLAGFELASGMFIRSALPQESAERWRRMFTLPHGPL
ncbi:MAG: hypothetical protein KGN02_13285 [bacterium]|nr:hypothetical protein [bacterium]